MKSKKITVFCGARKGTDPAFATLAAETGRMIAELGHTIVYGGGSVGLMGELANGALKANGKVVGIITQGLLEREVGHKALTEMIVSPNLSDRKRQLIEKADAFLVLPGGYGTLDELFEVVTWRQLGSHAKPLALVNQGGFFDGVLAFVYKAVESGLIPKGHESYIASFSTAEEALAALLRDS